MKFITICLVAIISSVSYGDCLRENYNTQTPHTLTESQRIWLEHRKPTRALSFAMTAMGGIYGWVRYNSVWGVVGSAAVSSTFVPVTLGLAHLSQTLIRNTQYKKAERIIRGALQELKPASENLTKKAKRRYRRNAKAFKRFAKKILKKHSAAIQDIAQIISLGNDQKDFCTEKLFKAKHLKGYVSDKLSAVGL